MGFFKEGRNGMADNFGLKIGLDGENDFKKALSDINQSFKVLGSEMKLISSTFNKNDKSVQAYPFCSNSLPISRTISPLSQYFLFNALALPHLAEPCSSCLR